MATGAVPVRIRTAIHFSLENSHRETSHRGRTFRSPWAFVEFTAPLRYEPCIQFINVSQRTLHIYFIDGCRVCPLDAQYKNRVNQPRLCASAHRGVPLYFCMARSYANFLVNYRLISPSSASSSVVMAKAILVAWSATLSSPDTISEKIMPASGEHSPLVRRSTCFFCSSRSFSST